MKNLLLLVLFSIGCAHSNAVAKPPVTTVDHVDLTRYVGNWYELASIPQWFQKECVWSTTAEYTARNNGKIDVVNTCVKKDGTKKVAIGRAKIVDPETNSKLKVTFAKILGKYIYSFGGAYWIIDLEPNYQYAVIGSPDRQYGWILARQPHLSDSDLVQISNNLIKQGYDTCKFITTIQKGGFSSNQPLCEYLK